MIKNVIFDIGNVLTTFCWKDFMRDFGYQSEIVERLAKATVMNEDWNEFDRGVLSREEIINLLVENDPGIEKEIRQVLSDVKGMVLKQDYAIPWIKDLKAAGYGVYYLSNFSEMGHIECKEALDFLPFTDGGILSYQDKVIKPDPAIYNLLLQRYGLVAEQCVFLDDTEKNLPPAEKLGIKTILFKDREQAVKELVALGVVTK